MKNRRLLYVLTILPITVLLVILVFSQTSTRSYIPRVQEPELTIRGAGEYLSLMRNNQITGEVDFRDVQKALAEIERSRSTAKPGGWVWEEMGPDNLGGRTRAIIIDKDDHNLMYAGAVSGGLWVSNTGGSSWTKVESIYKNMIISTIAQAPNGDIYVGTGEGFYPGIGDGTRGYDGIGIYKSSDGVNFSLLSSTTGWRYINRISVNQTTGYVYAATSSGLFISDDNGDSWSVNPIYSPNTSNVNVDDVKIAFDGTTVIVNKNFCYVSTDGVNFQRVSGLPSAGSRMEVAIAPSDPNYIYASLVDGTNNTQGIYRSTDKGQTWTQIGPSATPMFNIHRNQGDYNNTIAVYPNDKNKILVGGINIWRWYDGGSWTQITSGSVSKFSPLYVHVDIHAIIFHPTDPNVIFVGCDGGIHRSTNGGNSWVAMNKKYATIQYYAITSSGSGQLLGGTQDNSYQFIDFKGNTPGAARTVWGGDGGYAAISQLNPEAYVVSSQFGNAARTVNDGATWQKAYRGADPNAPEFFNKRMLNEGTPGVNFSHFVTPLVLWEDINVHDALDSIMFVADTTYMAGEEIILRSPNNGYPFKHTLLAGLNEGDSMLIQNPIQCVFIIAARTGLWMTREVLDVSKIPQWFKIGITTGGIIKTLKMSQDGDHLFVGTTGGAVYRFSNIRQAYDSLSADVTSANQVITSDLIGTWSGRAITSISVDPLNNDHVVVTLGNYGNTKYIFRSTDATSANPTFAQKQGVGGNRLPFMPVYGSLIPLHNPNILIVGTEYGTWITENLDAANPAWVEINEGMDRVPTLMIHQQTTNFPYTYYVFEDENERLVIEYPQTENYGAIYAGTHGRGAFRILNYVNVEEPKQQKPSIFRSKLLLYPNPVDNNATVVFNLNQTVPVMVNVYDLTGRVVASYDAGNMRSGRNEYRLDVSHLKRGSYIVQVLAGNESRTTKILKR